MTPPATDAVIAAPPRRFSLRGTFTALSYRNYRLWYFGQMLSLFGTWMQSTAQGYLMFELTRSTAYLGYTSFAAGISSWLFMLYGGVMADRLPRRKLLTVTQTMMMLLAAILAALTFTRLVQPWHILLLAFALGTANAFDAPARVSFVREMVEPDDMANAIALNGTMFNTATALGPAVGGVVYAAVGPAWCFSFNALSFIAVLVALQLMRITHLPPRDREASPLRSLRAGLGYVVHEPLARTLILTTAVFGLFGMVYVALLPAWAVNVLGGDATTNGLLLSARGAGALIGAFSIAALGRIHHKGRVATIGTLLMPAMLLLFSTVRWTPLALLLLFVSGFGQMLAFNMLNVLLQTLVPDELRGRVMSIYTLTFFGGMPLGALWAGQLAGLVGSPPTVALGAAVALLFALALLWKVPQLRRLT